jgi:hypothetical protein
VQLSCGPRQHPVAAPFLVSPFSGWSEIVSFVDHDLPDYAVDGKIVIANGITASAGDGQASDLFPSYWAPALRQYLNYDGHNGYDFDISYQPVLAAAAGTVQFAGWNSPDESAGYGQMILINHHNGYVTLYGHLSKLEVKTGERVRAGEEIGISGTTGHSSGPHLHFSVFHDCNVTDPYGWFGHGRDPLYSFDGERAQYLWLSGLEPHILNPPPGWPVDSLGVRVPVIAGEPPMPGGPTLDRLLLLALPDTVPAAAESSGVALADTDSRVTQEVETLVPALARLQARGSIRSFQVVPAAAAIWVRGTAGADELESLPGVASLSGVTTRDVAAAEAGLAHAVLAQIGQRQAPSLWPVGFRSALHTWQPTVSVLRGHALIAGFALPGQQVQVSLQRRTTLVGEALTLGDPQTGGFVVTIHDGAGKPVSVESGDLIGIACAGRSSWVHVARLTLRARSTRVVGQIGSLSAASLVARSSDSATVWRALARAPQDGQIQATSPSQLGVGSLAVATVVDDAGNQESASAYVPGIVAAEGSSSIRGWTVGQAPRLTVTRRGRVIASRSLAVASDGTFLLSLARGSKPMSLRAGDIVTIGSRAHHHSIVLPRLGVTLKVDARVVRVFGPAGARAQLALAREGRRTWSRPLRVPGAGSDIVTLAGKLQPGDTASLTTVLASGDQVVVTRSLPAALAAHATGPAGSTTHGGSAVASPRACHTKVTAPKACQTGKRASR